MATHLKILYWFLQLKPIYNLKYQEHIYILEAELLKTTFSANKSRKYLRQIRGGGVYLLPPPPCSCTPYYYLTVSSQWSHTCELTCIMSL